MALIETTIEDSVATVTLNRPEKRNALSIEMRYELADAVIRADDNATVLVLTGAGSAFCAGMDRSQFGGDAEHKRRLYESSVRVFEVLAEMKHPMIAAVNGPALGGGCALAAMGDMRIASTFATFGHPEVSFGVPASYAALLRIVAEPVARDLSLTGRTVGAEEALRMGILREVCADPLLRALEIANEMAKLGERVLRETKALMRVAEPDSLKRAREAEKTAFRLALFGSDQ